MIRRALRIPAAIARLPAARSLTIALMALGAAAMAAITVIEAIDSTGEVPYRLYLSWWFTSILGLAGLNLLLNLLRRSWWRLGKLPGVAAHSGFLLILAGGLLTWKLGVRGTLPVQEGETRDSFDVKTPVLHVSVRNGAGDRTYDLPLTPEGTFQARTVAEALLPFRGARRFAPPSGELVSIEDRSPSSRRTSHIAADPAGSGPPGIVLGVADAGGVSLVVELQAGDRVPLVKLSGYSHAELRTLAPGKDPRVALKRDSEERIEILPPGDAAVSIPVTVPGDVGRKLERSGYTVEVLEYHPDFKVGREPSPGDPPRNPALKLRVSGSAGAKTLFAFALFPDFHGNVMEDGTKVLYRRGEGGRTLVLACRAPSETPEVYAAEGGEPFRVRTDEWTEGGEGTALRLKAFLPSSIRLERVTPARAGDGPPAFLVRIGRETDPVWIAQGAGEAASPDGGTRTSVTGARPLGFALTLDDAVAKYWPASSTPRAFFSLVRIAAEGSAGSRSARIETNDPLSIGGFRLYQSGMDPEAPYSWSVFAVARDPGLPLVTAGFLLMSGGLLWLYAVRFLLKPLRARRERGKGGW